jgi:hypothetical protein
LYFGGNDERMIENSLVLYEEHILVVDLETQFLLVRDARNSNQVGGTLSRDEEK